MKVSRSEFLSDEIIHTDMLLVRPRLGGRQGVGSVVCRSSSGATFCPGGSEMGRRTGHASQVRFTFDFGVN